MSNVQVRVYVDRTAAILAGSATFGPQVFPIDPSRLTEAQRAALVRCRFEADAYSLLDAKTAVASVGYDNLHEVVAQQLDEISEHQRKRDEEERRLNRSLFDRARVNLEEWFAKPDADLVRVEDPYGRPEADAVEPWADYLNAIQQYGPEFMGPEAARQLLSRYKERLAGLKAVAVRKTLELKAEKEERARLRAAEEARIAEEGKAKEQRQVRQLAEWIDVHGTDNQKKRFRAGLLHKEEILDGMRQYAFASLDRFGRYRRITDEEVRLDLETDDDDEGGYGAADYSEPTVMYGKLPAKTANAEQFDALEAIGGTIRKAYPDAKVELFEHWGTIEGKGAVNRKSVKVTVRFGEFEFTREYAAPLEPAAKPAA